MQQHNYNAMPAARPRSAARERQVWSTAHGRRRRKRLYRPVLLLVFVFVLLSSMVYGFLGLLAPREEEQRTAQQGNVEAAGFVPVPKGDKFMLVLDAGHGGMDGGTHNTDKTILEKDITLLMVEKLASLLEANADRIEIVYTRQGDAFLTPAERAQIGNAAGADLFVSLHLNSDNSANVRGFQVFAQPSASSYHSSSMQLSQTLVDKVGSMVGLPILGDTGVYHMFYVENADGSYTATPRDSSWNIESELLGCDTYGVLQKSNCPAILVEQWYLSNSADMALMHNENGMNQMAECLYVSILEYFGIAG